MKYLCLAYEEQSILDALSAEQWRELRAETLDYASALNDGGHLVATHPLQSATTAVTVQVRGGKLAMTDGPFAETKEQLGGYFLIEASDLNEAVRIASQWPSARFGTIEVRPIAEGLDPNRRYQQ
jgi:hypothetical protein